MIHFIQIRVIIILNKTNMILDRLAKVTQNVKRTIKIILM